MVTDIPEGARGSASDGTPVIRRGGRWVAATKGELQAGAQQDVAGYKSALKSFEQDRNVYRGYRGQLPLLNQAADMVRGNTNRPISGLFGLFGKRDGVVNTGGLINNNWISGGTPSFSQDANAFDNLGKQLQIGMKPPGQDAQVTNFERELFASGAPSLRNRTPVNRSIIANRAEITSREGARLKFMEDYLQRHGNLLGAEHEWDDIAAKRRFAPPELQREGIENPDAIPNLRLAQSYRQTESDAKQRARRDWRENWRKNAGSLPGMDAAFDRWWDETMYNKRNQVEEPLRGTVNRGVSTEWDADQNAREMQQTQSGARVTDW